MAKKPPEPHEIVLDHLRALRQGVTKIEAHQRDHDKRFSMCRCLPHERGLILGQFD